MTIRKQALNNEAFTEMKAVYENREAIAKTWKQQGKQVVGVMGCDVPDELIIAAGMLPYRIYGSADLDLTQTNHYLEFSFPPSVRAQFEKIISGADSQWIDYLILSNSTDALLRIYYYIREMKALEPERKIPELYFIDWLFTRFWMHQVRNEYTIREFRQQLESWIGRKISDQDIRQAAEICNRNRVLLEKMSELRKKGRINGTEALIIIGSSMYMEKEKHSALLETLLSEAQSWEKTENVKVFVTGSAHEEKDFYELLEDVGMTAVSEDHDWGDRHWNKSVNTELDPIKAIVDRYMLRSAGTKRAFVSERVKAVTQAAEQCGAKAVISYTHIYDDAPSWDYPEQAKALKEKDIFSLQLARKAYKVNDNENMKAELQAFLTEIKEG